MYRGNEFDGGPAAFMGGGFMPTQITQPSDSSTSFSNSRNREGRCLLPLTVKNINELQSNDESNFVIDGVEVSNVTIVGRVCQKEDKASEYTFLVDDGTGRIDCTRWVQERIDTDEVEGILVGKYVRVHGHLRGLQGRRFLNAFSIRPITDFNEITSHFIECIYVHFYNTKIRLQGASAVTAPPQLANSAMNTPVTGYQASNYAPPPLANSAMNTSLTAYQAANYEMIQGLSKIPGLEGLSFTALTIMSVLLQPANHANENGVNRNFIAHQLNLPMDKLMEELQNLVDNGSVYSTIDEDHFKSTVNG